MFVIILCLGTITCRTRKRYICTLIHGRRREREISRKRQRQRQRQRQRPENFIKGTVENINTNKKNTKKEDQCTNMNREINTTKHDGEKEGGGETENEQPYKDAVVVVQTNGMQKNKNETKNNKKRKDTAYIQTCMQRHACMGCERRARVRVLCAFVLKLEFLFNAGIYR
ncbi:hypothetical protein BYT27DRAFT_6543542 [Phlegmacium glaucopus]|nr:hypothetical protein BYT27DRAFT_6543542 [Phlegmacium glaucopus]